MAEHSPPSAPSAVDPAHASLALESLRGRGAHRVHPVRFRFIESLARRAALTEGATRRLLDDRLAQLLRDYEALALPGQDAVHPADSPPPASGPLGDLLDHVARQAEGDEASRVVAPLGAKAASPPAAVRGAPAGELKTVRYFRRTWARLGAEQRLAQSRSSLPENAGPLHSHHLVHRALQLMQSLSPEYLERFIGHVETLQWLERAIGGAPAPRPDAERKGARARRG